MKICFESFPNFSSTLRMFSNKLTNQHIIGAEHLWLRCVTTSKLGCHHRFGDFVTQQHFQAALQGRHNRSYVAYETWSHFTYVLWQKQWHGVKPGHIDMWFVTKNHMRHVVYETWSQKGWWHSHTYKAAHMVCEAGSTQHQTLQWGRRLTHQKQALQYKLWSIATDVYIL